MLNPEIHEEFRELLERNRRNTSNTTTETSLVNSQLNDKNATEELLSTEHVNRLKGHLVPSIDKILGHYYKQKVAKFRTTSKEYHLITIASIEQLLEKHPGTLKEYMLSLTTRAIRTLVTRHPATLELLRIEGTSIETNVNLTTKKEHTEPTNGEQYVTPGKSDHSIALTIPENQNDEQRGVQA